MIVSTANPTVKRLTSLHERRGRLQEGLFLIEGVRLVEEALAGSSLPQIVAFAPDLLQATARGRALLHRLTDSHVATDPLLEVSAAVLRRIAQTETPAGVVAALALPPTPPLADLPQRGGLTLILDGVQDPGNAGTMLRSAAAAGVDAVIALQGCVDLFAPKVVRAGMGAHLRLALAVESLPEAVSDWATQRSVSQGGRAILADARGDHSLYTCDLTRPTVVVVGGEAHGAQVLGEWPALQRVRIPMPGGMESLNVAAATAIILFEAVRQRGTPG